MNPEKKNLLKFEANTPDIVCETVDEEVIVVDLRTGAYYSFSSTAAFIWQGLNSGFDLSRVIDSACDFYGVAKEKIEENFQSFTSSLVSEGLLRAGSENNPPAAFPLPAKKEAFQPPAFEKFSDMKEFLLVDPIHEVNVRGWPHKSEGDSAPSSPEDQPNSPP